MLKASKKVFEGLERCFEAENASYKGFIFFVNLLLLSLLVQSSNPSETREGYVVI